LDRATQHLNALNDDLKRLTEEEAGYESQSQIGARFDARGQRLQPPDVDDADIPAQGEIYYRTPLTVSAEQVEMLSDLIDKGGFAAGATIRVSRPENPNAYATPAELHRMAERVRKLRAGDVSVAESTHASLFPVGQLRAAMCRDLLQTTIAATIGQMTDADTLAGGAGRGKRKHVQSFYADPYESGSGDTPSMGLQHFDGRPSKRTRRDFGRTGGVGSHYDPMDTGDVQGAHSDGTGARYAQSGKQAAISGGQFSNMPAMTPTFCENFSAIHAKANEPLLRILALALQGTPMTRQVLENMADGDIIIPLNAIVARPHMRYDTQMLIKTLAGKATGRTYMGHSNFQLEDNAKVKMHYGNYTYYARALVTNPKNVFLIFDAFVDGVRGGAGVVPYALPSYQPRNGQYGKGSLFFFAVPYEERKFPNPMDASGRFIQYFSDSILDKENLSELHFSTAPRYNSHWGFVTEADIGGTAFSLDPGYFEGDAPLNTVMYRGHTELVTRGAHELAILINTGHWGPNVYPGCRAVRNGQLTALKEMDYESRSAGNA
jgi:hypothetical protein